MKTYRKRIARKSYNWFSRPGRSRKGAKGRKALSLYTYGFRKPLQIFKDPPAELAAQFKPYALYADLDAEERLLRPFMKCMVAEERKESHLILALADKKLIPVQDFETLTDSEYNELYPPVFKKIPKERCPNVKISELVEEARLKNEIRRTCHVQPKLILDRVDSERFRKSPMLDHHCITRKLLAVLAKSKIMNRRVLRSDTSGTRNIVQRNLAIIDKTSPQKRVLRSDVDGSMKRRLYFF